MQPIAPAKNQPNQTDYFQAIANSGLLPNFWCSDTYWDAADWTCHKFGATVWVQDSDGVLMLPPMTPLFGINRKMCIEPIWSSLPGMEIGRGTNDFLDWNYYYNPGRIAQADGPEFSTFRKNRKKWPDRHQDWRWGDEKPDVGLVIRWAGERDYIHSAEILEWYLKNAPHHICLYYKRQMVAWMAWDYNPMTVNFRWLIVDPEHAFLDEYCRAWFYEQHKNSARLVNDGGTLGSKSLEFFKDRLCPLKKEPIYSWSPNEKE